MEQKTLTAVTRTEMKKGGSRKLRSAGKIPGIVYGAEKNSPVTVDEHEFMMTFRDISENTIISLEIDGKATDVLVKDYQQDILSSKVAHVDFYEITKGHTLKTRLPLVFEGTPAGVREGGLQESFMHELEIECLPKDLPEKLKVDISELKIGDSIHVGDLELPEGVKSMVSNENVVVVVTHAKGEETETDEDNEEEMEESTEE